MRTIHKYPLHGSFPDGVTKLLVPQGSKVVLVGEQRGGLFIWFDVNRLNPLTERTFHVFGTGFEIPPNLGHVGSVQIDDYVWHVFE